MIRVQLLFVGSKIEIWSGSISYKKIALLCVVVLQGYHSLTKYQWKRNGDFLSGEVFPHTLRVKVYIPVNLTIERVSPEPIVIFKFEISGEQF